MKKIILQLLLLIIIFSLSLLGYFKYNYLFSSFENKLNDLMFIARGEKKADRNIIIIDIDEKSLKELGQWPWSRDKVSKIIQNLTNLDIGIIGLDVVFAEYDNSSPKRVLKDMGIKEKIDAVDYDEILAQTISNSPTIVGYVFTFSNDGLPKGNPPKNRAIIIEKNKPKNSYLLKPYRAILNIPEIQNAAYSNGYFNTIPDEDGVVRSIPMVVEYDGILYPSLSLEIIRIALGANKIIINYYNNGVESIQIGNITIPTDRFARLHINYRGSAHSYTYLSATDIYHNRVKRKEIEGKLALLGTSAAGLLDLRSTPFDSVYPGVEVHATALDNIINNDFIESPPWIVVADIIDIFIILLIGFIIILISNAFISFLLFVTVLYGISFLHFYLMFHYGIILNTFFPIFSLILLFIIGESINYFFETRQKEKIKRKFAAKVSPAVVDELIKNNTGNMLEGREKEITIFFSDIRSFTTISEELGSAKALISLLNSYMTPMVDIITRYKGTVDKFIGDAIMAYWNAPLDIPNHPDQALKASIEQIFALETINKNFELENKPRIEIGIGLNTGFSIVGEMGSSGRSDYTCIGDPVNLASRAEGLCKHYGAKIILTEFTKKTLEEEIYLIRELDIVKVKGKDKPVKIYECAGYLDNYWKNFYQDENQYLEALKYYKNSDFKRAYNLFETLYKNKSHKLYSLYMERCLYFIKNPPKNFDGVFKFYTK